MLSFYKTLTHRVCLAMNRMVLWCYGGYGYALWCYKEDGVMVVGMSGYKKDGGYAR